jgi:hypothetical protein
MKTREQKTEQLLRDSINKMMEIAGHKERYDDLLEKENWFTEFTMTPEQEDEWNAWFVSEAKKRMKWPKRTAQREFSYLNLMYGLKIEEK